MPMDKQPRRPSNKDLPLEKVQKPSAMGSRAKGGDKVSNQGLPSRKESQGLRSTTSKKPRRP